MKFQVYCNLLFAVSFASNPDIHKDAQNLLKEFDSNAMTSKDNHFEEQVSKLRRIVQSGEQSINEKSKSGKMHLVPEGLLNSYLKYLKWQDGWLRRMMNGIKQITQRVSRNQTSMQGQQSMSYGKDLGQNGYLYSPTMINGRIQYVPINRTTSFPMSRSQVTRNFSRRNAANWRQQRSQSIGGRRMMYRHHSTRSTLTQIHSREEAKARIKILQLRMHQQTGLQRKETQRMIQKLKVRFHVKTSPTKKINKRHGHLRKVHRGKVQVELKIRTRISRLRRAMKVQSGEAKRKTQKMIKKLEKRIHHKKKSTSVGKHKMQMRIKALKRKLKTQDYKGQKAIRKQIKKLEKKMKKVQKSRSIRFKAKLNKMEKKTRGMKTKVQMKIKALKRKLKTQDQKGQRAIRKQIKKLEKTIKKEVRRSKSSTRVKANLKKIEKKTRTMKNKVQKKINALKRKLKTQDYEGQKAIRKQIKKLEKKLDKKIQKGVLKSKSIRTKVLNKENKKNLKREVKAIKMKAKKEQQRIVLAAKKKEKDLKKKIVKLEESLKGKTTDEKAVIKDQIKEAKQTAKRTKENAKVAIKNLKSSTALKVTALKKEIKNNATSKLKL